MYMYNKFILSNEIFCSAPAFYYTSCIRTCTVIGVFWCFASLHAIRISYFSLFNYVCMCVCVCVRVLYVCVKVRERERERESERERE